MGVDGELLILKVDMRAGTREMRVGLAVLLGVLAVRGGGSAVDGRPAGAAARRARNRLRWVG